VKHWFDPWVTATKEVVVDETTDPPTTARVPLTPEERQEAAVNWGRDAKRDPKRGHWPGQEGCNKPKSGPESCSEAGRPHRHCECGLAIDLDHGYCDTCIDALIRGAAMSDHQSLAMKREREEWLERYGFIQFDADGVHIVYR
jgi:hypothetical protein